MYTLVAPCFFGTEHTLSFEVKRLGAQNVKVTDGRVAFEGDAAMIAAANLNLRTKAFDLKGKGMLGAKKAGSHQNIHVGHSVSFLGLCMAQPDMRGRAYWVSPAG